MATWSRIVPYADPDAVDWMREECPGGCGYPKECCCCEQIWEPREPTFREESKN